jgi:hypothetical protein
VLATYSDKLDLSICALGGNGGVFSSGRSCIQAWLYSTNRHTHKHAHKTLDELKQHTHLVSFDFLPTPALLLCGMLERTFALSGTYHSLLRLNDKGKIGQTLLRYLVCGPYLAFHIMFV